MQKLRPAEILSTCWPYKVLTFAGLVIAIGISLPCPVGPTGLTKSFMNRLVSLRPKPQVYTSPFSLSAIVCLSPATASLILMLCLAKYSTSLNSFCSLLSPCPSLPSAPLP